MALAPTSSGGGSSSDASAYTTVTKLVDESVASSIVLQADDELKFTAVSGGLYEIEAYIIYASPAGAGTPDMRLTFGEDAVVRGVLQITYIATTDLNGGASFLTDNTTTQVNVGTAATNRAFVVNGFCTGGGGVFGFYWAQTTSGVNPTIVRAGSVLRYRRIL